MREIIGRWLAAAAFAAVASAGSMASASPALTSHVMSAPPFEDVANGYYEPITITKAGGGIFDLQSLDLAFGTGSPLGLHDTITLTGVFADSHSEGPLVLDVQHGFQTQQIDWTGLTSVTFLPFSTILGADGLPLLRYLALDNLHYSTAGGGAAVSDFEDIAAGTGFANALESGGLNYGVWFGLVYGPERVMDFPTQVPEPATWAMLLLGFFGVGSALRGARRKAALA
jgi:hypothetical protein